MKPISAMTQAELAEFVQSRLRKNEIYVTLSGRVALSIMPQKVEIFPKTDGIFRPANLAASPSTNRSRFSDCPHAEWSGK